MKGPRCYQRSRSPPLCLRAQGPLEAAKCAALYHNFAAAVSYYLLRTPASSSLGNGDNVGQERLAELPPCAATAVPAAAAAAAAAAALVVFLHSHAMGAPEGGDGLRACMRSNDFEVRLLLLYIFTSPDSVSF